MLILSLINSFISGENNRESVCVSVNELVCNLEEANHYATLELTYQVYRRFTGKDRVCETTYKIYTTTNVESPNCFTK